MSKTDKLGVCLFCVSALYLGARIVPYIIAQAVGQ